MVVKRTTVCQSHMPPAGLPGQSQPGRHGTGQGAARPQGGGGARGGATAGRGATCGSATGTRAGGRTMAGARAAAAYPTFRNRLVSAYYGIFLLLETPERSVVSHTATLNCGQFRWALCWNWAVSLIHLNSSKQAKCAAPKEPEAAGSPLVFNKPPLRYVPSSYVLCDGTWGGWVVMVYD